MATKLIDGDISNTQPDNTAVLPPTVMTFAIASLSAKLSPRPAETIRQLFAAATCDWKYVGLDKLDFLREARRSKIVQH